LCKEEIALARQTFFEEREENIPQAGTPSAAPLEVFVTPLDSIPPNEPLFPVKAGSPAYVTKSGVVLNNYSRNDGEYCTMTHLKDPSLQRENNWQGAERWRWLFFGAAFFPLILVGYSLAVVLSYIVTLVGAQNVCSHTITMLPLSEMDSACAIFVR
jgi:hypothetical protein